MPWPKAAREASHEAPGYEQQDLIEGVIISGASVVHEQIKNGAATLSF